MRLRHELLELTFRGYSRFRRLLPLVTRRSPLAAYSTAKAGLTQLARVAALEWGQKGIRVNTLHPNGVFDTGIWTSERLENRAKSYGLSVEEYRARNVLGISITSEKVADMALAMAGPTFSCTTGAQVPVDGGNNRVI